MEIEALGPVVAVASEAVRDAVRFMRTVDPDAIGSTLTKGNGSPVTVADFVVQACVASQLERHFPADPLVAEENASALNADEASHVRNQVLRLVREMLPAEPRGHAARSRVDRSR